MSTWPGRKRGSRHTEEKDESLIQSATTATELGTQTPFSSAKGGSDFSTVGYGLNNSTTVHSLATSDSEKYFNTLSTSDVEGMDTNLEEPAISPRDDQNRIQLSQLADTINNLAEKQLEISSKRLQARELRIALKYKREEEGIARAELQKKLYALSAKGVPEDLQAIIPLLERTQSCSDSYLVLENEYHHVEDQLGQDEYTLSKMEQKLSSALKRLSTTIDYNDGDNLHSQRSSTSSTAISYVDYPPLLSEYLSRVGDVNILEERLLDLDRELFDIKEQERLRFGLSIPLGEESRQFLLDYDERQSEIQADLDVAKEDVARLHAKCKEEGILGGGQGDGQGYDQDICFSVVELKNISEKDKDPLRVSEFEDNSPFFEPNNAQSVNTTEFVNKWILHRLRHSAMEVLQLKSDPTLQELSQAGSDSLAFSRLVLSMWYKDDAVATPPPQTTSASEHHMLSNGSEMPNAKTYKRRGWSSRFSEGGWWKRPSASLINNPRPKSF